MFASRVIRRIRRVAAPRFRRLAPLNVGSGSELQKRALALADRDVFVGGPPAQFHAVGVHQFVTLLESGLMPHHRVLDIGCGCLRAGYWLIHFLDADCYCGIEPNQSMLKTGLEEILGDGIVLEKAPRWSSNTDFDFGVFERTFDFMLARSIWSHAAQWQIEKMLDQFVAWSNPHGVLLTSYLKVRPFERQYNGTTWVGRSHESDEGGMIRYRFSWVREQCAKRGLVARELDRNILDQVWLRIERGGVGAVFPAGRL